MARRLGRLLRLPIGAWVCALTTSTVLIASCNSGARPATPATSPTPSEIANSALPAPSPSTTALSGESSAPRAAALTPLPVTPGFGVLDLTWISNSHGWALAATPCTTGICGRVFTTSDGGTTWLPAPSMTAITVPADTQRCQSPACVEHIRFASSTTGFLWGGGGRDALFMTTDGGQTWVRQSSPVMLGLEIVAGWAFRLATDVLPGPMVVERARVGTSSWQRMDVGATGNFGGTLATSDTSVYVAFLGHVAGGAQNAQTTFARSTDGGNTWRTFGDPCGANSSGMEMDAWVSAAGPGSLFGVLCLARDGRGDITLMTSIDGGGHFGGRSPLPTSASRQALQLALPSANVEVVASGGLSPQPSVVVRSEDGGGSWTGVLEGPSVVQRPALTPDVWLGFEDPLVGRVAFGTHSVWTSNDSGRSWREALIS